MIEYTGVPNCEINIFVCEMHVVNYIDVHDPTNCTTVVDDKMILTVSIYLALFPGLLRFYLLFVFTIIHESRRPAKKQRRPGSIHHVSGRDMDIGGRGRYTNI